MKVEFVVCTRMRVLHTDVRIANIPPLDALKHYPDIPSYAEKCRKTNSIFYNSVVRNDNNVLYNK